ncbi:MAG: DUF3899 domain-containing protein [Acholeplasmataceae bacterium]|nr:DUF3899 domain-containing protein [Acholeplasmataceae bacterium]
MLKKLLVAFVIYGAILYGAYFLMHGNKPATMIALSDTLFVVGLPIFFISLIATTNAGKLFVFIGYSLKSMFSRSLRQTPYYQYHQEKMKKGLSLYPLIFLLMSIACMAASFIIVLI